MFRLSRELLDAAALRGELENPGGGCTVVFESKVPDREEDVPVLQVEYEAYDEMAIQEGGRILGELKERYGLASLICVHRIGVLKPGDLTAWIGAASRQSREAFWAAAQALDAIKKQVPIWRRESTGDGRNAWIPVGRGKIGHAG